MDTSTLCPPNSHMLSNNVICNVKQRARANRSYVVGVSDSHTTTRTMEKIQFHTPERKQLAQQCAVSDRRTTLPSFESSRKMTVTELLHLGEKLHRERRRNNQRRYRKKQDDYMASLENDTQKLQKEIGKLQRRRRSGPTNDLVSTVMEYFDLFTHHDQLSKTAMLDFVQASMVPDVMCTSGCGPDAVVKEMQAFQLFNDVKVKLESLQLGTNDSVITYTATLLTITERVFPYLFSSPNENHQLLARVLGQRIVVHSSTCFGWDNICGGITSVSTQSDLLTPMLRLVGNLEDVSRVFEMAFITPDFQWTGSTL